MGFEGGKVLFIITLLFALTKIPNEILFFFTNSLFSVTRIFEQFDSTSMMLLFMLMPFIEEEVRSFLLREDVCMHVS